jgi:riboflavin synthase
MFTGIIEAMGTIQKIAADRTNKVFWITSEISLELRVDESLSHNGVCLTVEEVHDGGHRVTAIQETLDKSNAGLWKEGDHINLERSMKMNGRLDGHIVQGHVDGTAVCTAKNDRAGSVEFSFRFDSKDAGLMIEKGSISLNGISLTAFNVARDSFTVAIIPYTIAHTNFDRMQVGDVVNLEFDILGKYVARILTLNATS